jgi:hypothetical protein
MGATVKLMRDPLTADEHQHAWEALCSDETLAGIAYKIETDAWGAVRISPTQAKHSRMVGRIRTCSNKSWVVKQCPSSLS